MAAAGLIPAIVQDAGTGRVLMLAHMNGEARRHTAETGLATFWSRPRRELWQKGETSGNTLGVLEVEELQDDCDGDAILRACGRPARPATPGRAPAARRGSGGRRRNARSSGPRART